MVRRKTFKRKSWIFSFFKVFFWIYCAASIAGIYFSIPEEKDAGSLSLFLFSVGIVFFVGAAVYLCAYEKTWIFPWFWKVLFFLYCAKFIYSMLVVLAGLKGMFQQSPMPFDNYILTYIFLVAVVMFFPAAFALYRYAFDRSR